MHNLKLGSLFDGSGGFPLGGMLAGITPVWASEVEPFAVRVTTKRIPFMKHYGDISAMDGGKIEPVDIITFGSPCQDMSVAGKRNGLDGSRSSLFYEAVRIIKEMRSATNGKYPRYIVWENVPGAFSSNGGRDFKAVLEAVIGIVEENAEVPAPDQSGWPYADLYLGDGWSLAYRTLDAQYWGVPQRRRRIFLVADFAGGSAPDVLFKSEGLSRYSPQGFRSWQRTANDTEGSPRATGIGIDGYNADLTGDKAATLGVNCGMSTGRNGVVLNDQGGNRMDVTEDVTCTLRAEAHHPPCVVESAGFCTEHSSKSRSIGYEKECAPTLRSGVVPATLALENHPNDGRIKIEEDGKVQTLSSRMGTGGNNVPLVMNTPSTWDGKQVAPTLTKQNAGGNQRMPDKDNFNCVLQPFGISSADSNAMKSSNPHSGIYEAETSRTIDANGGNPSCNQGGIAVVCIDQGGGKSACNVTEEKAPTLTCTHGGEPAVCLQGSMIGRKDTNGPQGDGVSEDVSFTLNTIDRHAVFGMTTGSFTQVDEECSPTLMARDYKDPNAVCYGVGRDAFNQGKNAQFTPSVREESQPTLVAKGPGAVALPYGFDPSASRDLGQYFLEDCGNTLVNGSCPGHHNGVMDSNYTVRRLTPTECARLQGFPDYWCENLETPNPTDEEITFWVDVWNTYARVIGTCKSKTEKQVKRWLENPHCDSAEYKLWGNGVALPCVFFVLAGIVYCTHKTA